MKDEIRDCLTTYKGECYLHVKKVVSVRLNFRLRKNDGINKKIVFRFKAKP